MRENTSHHAPGGDYECIERAKMAMIKKEIADYPRLSVFTSPEDYDEAYDGYAGDRMYYLPKMMDGRVLNGGPGTGRLFQLAARVNKDILGVELFQEMIDAIRNRYSHITDKQIVQGDLLKMNFSENCFDRAIYEYSFLQYFDSLRKIRRLLRKTFKWLKPGGEVHADTFSPWLIPRDFSPEMSVRVVDKNKRIEMYAEYEVRRSCFRIKQRMVELAIIYEEGEPPKVIEMDYSFWYPEQIRKIMEQVGFQTELYGGYDLRPYDPNDQFKEKKDMNEIVVYKGTKPK